MADRNEKLRWTTKLIYGVGDVGNAVVNSAIQFFLMIFYTDAALVAPALVGSALLVGKVWDAVNDPLFGWVSDRTTSRFGKRRVYMIFGALPLAIAVLLLWRVPRGLPDTWTFIWIAFTFMLFDTMWTLTNVPYYALTAELTDDYDERASLTAFRMVLGVPAYIVGAALTPAIVGLFATKRAGYSAIGVAYGVLAAVVLWVAAAGLRERKRISESQCQTPPLRTFLATFKNRPFVRLIGAYLMANSAFALLKTLLAYFLTYQLGMEDQVPVVMFLLLVFVGLSLFPWKMLSDRWNKGPAYALGLAIGGLAVASTFLLPHEPTGWVYPIAILAGIGFSVNWVFPWAMVPDVVEYDRMETGEHRGGMYYGVWGLAVKVSEALGITASGWVLQLFGYVPNVEQSAHALLGIRLFFGPVPLVFFALALPLLIWYPITRASHAEVRRRLGEKEAVGA
ncbi:MAG TPA: MFS transporter [Anaerolineae bacterium]|nr:MFS transporter [Anaerolineae bacterium]